MLPPLLEVVFFLFVKRLILGIIPLFTLNNALSKPYYSVFALTFR